MCNYELTNESLKLTNVERIVVEETYIRRPIANMIESLRRTGKVSKDLVEAIVEGVRKQITFEQGVSRIRETIAEYLKHRDKRFVSENLRKAINEQLKRINNIQKAAMHSAKRTYTPVYRLEEGKECIISFDKPKGTIFEQKITWKIRKARKSLSDKILQSPLIEKIVVSREANEDEEVAVKPLIESYASNVKNGWLITRSDIYKTIKRVLRDKSIVVVEQKIKAIASDIHNSICEHNKDEIGRLLVEAYGSISAIKTVDISNAVSVARKALYLREQGKQIQNQQAIEVLLKEAENEEVVDAEIEDMTDDESTEDYKYSADDIKDYIKLLKNILKEIDEDKYNEISGEEEGENEGAEEAKPEPEEEPKEKDFFDEDSDEEVDESFVRKIEESAEEGDNVIAYEEEDDMEGEDDSGDVIDDLSEVSDEDEDLYSDDEGQEIVNMIDELQKMLDEEQIDGERVSEIAKWIYDFEEETASEVSEKEEEESKNELPGVDDEKDTNVTESINEGLDGDITDNEMGGSKNELIAMVDSGDPLKISKLASIVLGNAITPEQIETGEEGKSLEEVSEQLGASIDAMEENEAYSVLQELRNMGAEEDSEAEPIEYSDELGAEYDDRSVGREE